LRKQYEAESLVEQMLWGWSTSWANDMRLKQ